MKIAKILSNTMLPLAVIAFAGFTAQAQTNSEISTSDTHFVKSAAEGGMAEVELGKLAEEKASNPEVKKFAERMVNDHTQANDQLKEVASSKHIALPTSLDAKDEATKQKLASLSGEEFDKAYMRDMVIDHTKDVTEFRHERASAQDSAVKDFAAKTLPTIEDHLKEARQIEPKVERASR
jgi:putative membrane protein